MCPTTWFWGFSVMLVGYMRVSSTDDRQSVDLQRDALTAAGVDQRHLYSDKASGARDDRAGLKACLDYMNAGDTLVVWKLDRLGRSLRSEEPTSELQSLMRIPYAVVCLYKNTKHIKHHTTN